LQIPKLSVFQVGSRLQQQLRQAVISSKVAVPWLIFKKSLQLPGSFFWDKSASTQHIIILDPFSMNEYRYCQNLPDVKYGHTVHGFAKVCIMNMTKGCEMPPPGYKVGGPKGMGRFAWEDLGRQRSPGLSSGTFPWP